METVVITAEIVVEAMVVIVEETEAGPEKCIKPSVLTAKRRPKYLSNHPVTDLYTAGNVSKSTNQNDFDLLKMGQAPFFHFNLYQNIR